MRPRQVIDTPEGRKRILLKPCIEETFFFAQTERKVVTKSDAKALKQFVVFFVSFFDPLLVWSTRIRSLVNDGKLLVLFRGFFIRETGIKKLFVRSVVIEEGNKAPNFAFVFRVVMTHLNLMFFRVR
jgi:hypothetical protein